jgi:hypothetical protein
MEINRRLGPMAVGCNGPWLKLVTRTVGQPACWPNLLGRLATYYLPQANLSAATVFVLLVSVPYL